MTLIAGRSRHLPKCTGNEREYSHHNYKSFKNLKHYLQDNNLVIAMTDDEGTLVVLACELYKKKIYDHLKSAGTKTTTTSVLQNNIETSKW